ncbi:MAG: type II toxin-antitoxin system VapC family toxin [Candidatus Bipolaricaulia bacterium]
MKTFVDTSALYALADGDDHYHDQAKNVYESLKDKTQLVTTDYILLECWYLMSNHLGREEALQFWDGLTSGAVEIVDLDLLIRRKAREIIEDFSDQDFSLVDAASFALMEQGGIERAFAFDSHFQIYRFGEENENYFEVIPTD